MLVSQGFDELLKSNPHPDPITRIPNPKEFDDLDEIVAMYIEPRVDLTREMTSHRKYADVKEDEVSPPLCIHISAQGSVSEDTSTAWLAF